VDSKMITDHRNSVSARTRADLLQAELPLPERLNKLC
jgi:hypothetical protein